MYIIFKNINKSNKKQSMKEDVSDHRALYDKYASSSNQSNIVTQSYSTSSYTRAAGNQATVKQSSYKISDLPIIYDTPNRSGTPSKYDSSSRVIYTGSANKVQSGDRGTVGTVVGGTAASVPKYDNYGMLSYTNTQQAETSKSGPTNIRNMDYGYAQNKGQAKYEVSNSSYNKSIGSNPYSSSVPYSYNPDSSSRTIIAGLGESKPTQYKVSSSYSSDYKLQSPSISTPSYDNKIEANAERRTDTKQVDPQEKMNQSPYYQTNTSGYQASTNYTPASNYTSSSSAISANIANNLSNRLSNIVGYQAKPNSVNPSKTQASKQQTAYIQVSNKVQNVQKPTTPAYPSSYNNQLPSAYPSGYSVPSQASITGVDLSSLGYGNSIAHSPTVIRSQPIHRVVTSQNMYAIPADIHYVGSSPNQDHGHVDLSELGYSNSPSKQVDPAELEYRRLPGDQVGFYVKPPPQYTQVVHQQEYQGVGIDLAYPIRTTPGPPPIDLSQLGYGNTVTQTAHTLPPQIKQVTQVTQSIPHPMPYQPMPQQMVRQVMVQQVPQTMEQSKSRSRLNISNLSSETVPKVQYDRCVNQCKNWQTKYNQLYLKYMNLATSASNQPSSMEADSLREENYRLKLALREQEERRRQMLPLLESKFADMVNSQRQATIRQAMLLIERYKLQSKQNKL